MTKVTTSLYVDLTLCFSNHQYLEMLNRPIGNTSIVFREFLDIIISLNQATDVLLSFSVALQPLKLLHRLGSRDY